MHATPSNQRLVIRLRFSCVIPGTGTGTFVLQRAILFRTIVQTIARRISAHPNLFRKPFPESANISTQFSRGGPSKRQRTRSLALSTISIPRSRVLAPAPIIHAHALHRAYTPASLYLTINLALKAAAKNPVVEYNDARVPPLLSRGTGALIVPAHARTRSFTRVTRRGHCAPIDT